MLFGIWRKVALYAHRTAKHNAKYSFTRTHHSIATTCPPGFSDRRRGASQRQAGVPVGARPVTGVNDHPHSGWFVFPP